MQRQGEVWMEKKIERAGKEAAFTPLHQLAAPLDPGEEV
jgi:hypothetical protein